MSTCTPENKDQLRTSGSEAVSSDKISYRKYILCYEVLTATHLEASRDTISFKKKKKRYFFVGDNFFL